MRVGLGREGGRPGKEERPGWSGLDSRNRDLESKASGVGPSSSPEVKKHITLTQREGISKRKKEAELFPALSSSLPAPCWFRSPGIPQAKLEHLAHPAPQRRR